MATHAIALGASISAAIAAGAAGDTYTFANGVYYGQSYTPNVGDIFIRHPSGTTISGAWNITSWTNVSANWYRATQGLSDANGATQTNIPLPNNTPETIWRGTATISGTTISVVTTTAGTFRAPSGTEGLSLYGNGLAAATVVTGATTVSPSQTVSVARPMILVTQAFESAGNGVAANDPLAYLSEELFVDGARYTRIQAAAVPVAPGASQWFFDYANSSININLATPTSHLIEYSCTTAMCNVGTGSLFTMYGIKFEKYARWEQAAILTFPDGRVRLIDCDGVFNSGCAVNCGDSGSYEIIGGHYSDNGANAIIGSPHSGLIQDAEVARNNGSNRLSIGWQAGGIKLTGSHDTRIIGCNVHDNGGTGIWLDISCLRDTIAYNTVRNNAASGIATEISFLTTIAHNTVANNGSAEIFYPNSSGVVIVDNDITVGLGHGAQGRVGGGICTLNVARSSASTVAACSFTGTITSGGSTLAVSALTGAVAAGMAVHGSGLLPGSFIVQQLTGTAGSTGNYRLNQPQPALTGRAMVGFVETSGMLWEARNSRVLRNRITHLDAVGALNGIGIDQAIVGGSNDYWDFNTYYTPNNTSSYWNRSTDAGVDTTYTWAAYQAAGFEPNSTNVVGVAPGIAAPPNPSPYLRSMQGPVTLAPLDILTVTTGGTAVNAFSAGHVTAGGKIQNPPTASTSLGINQNGTASGTTDNGGTRFYKPGAFCWLAPSSNAVSVISSDSAHPFAGEGWT